MVVRLTDPRHQDELVAFLRRYRYAAYRHEAAVVVLGLERPLARERLGLEQAVENWSRLNAPSHAYIDGSTQLSAAASW